MTEAMGVLALVLGSLPLVVIFLALGGMCQSRQYDPMSYDEEMRWLTEDCGLSREEADEIANLPSRCG